MDVPVATYLFSAVDYVLFDFGFFVEVLQKNMA